MKIISNQKVLKQFTHNEKNLGFVPTMGSIHKGHISLVKKSLSQCDKTLVSIFVNGPQFNNKSEFKRYPRTLKKDILLLRKTKINYLYLPTTNQIYPKGPNKKIKINSFGKKLCGKFRPGHFEAVIDVMDRFAKIIIPKKIYLGEKDMQQLKLIDHFIKNNHKKIKIIACKTIREKNGLACSSRNLLLSSKNKVIGSRIYNLLKNKKRDLIQNKRLLKAIKRKIFKFGVNKIDYIKILNINKLIKPHKKGRKYKIFIAYYLGAARLIDNI